jgi:hypothetical protein
MVLKLNRRSTVDSEAFGLGDRVKDSVTGLQGIVICMTYWLHGCIRVGVQPEETKDGKPAEAVYFDQTQLVLVKAGVHQPQQLAVAPQQPEAPTRRSPGGPSREGASFRR